MQQKSGNKKKISIIVIITSLAAIGIAIVGSVIVTSDLFNSDYRIEVEGEDIRLFSNKPYAPQIIEECKNDVHCAVNSMQTIAGMENSQNVIDTFVSLIHLYEQTYSCHETAHHLGMWLYGYVKDVREALSYSEQVCGGAIFHGVIQNYVMTQKLQGTSLNKIDIKSICLKPSGNPYYIEHWQCLHGLGHGLIEGYDYDVLSAIKRCEEFEPGWEQLSCSKGVFMQNVIHYLETGQGDFDEDDLYYPCNAVESKRSAPCYHYHVTYMVIKNKGNVQQTFNDCDKILPADMVKYCYYGFGRQLEPNIGNSIEAALLLCQAGQKSEYHSDCLKGMLLTIVNVNTNTDRGFSFCKLLPEQYKKDCYDGLGRWILMLQENQGDQLRKEECAKSENDNYFKVCMNSSLESIILL